MSRATLPLDRLAGHADRPLLTPARLGALLALLALLATGAGLAAGSEGWSFAWGEDAALIQSIRAPRTLGALAVGALLGLAGALAQGLFRNALADPFLLGSAAGAGLGVVLVLAAGSAVASQLPALAGLVAWAPSWLADGGLVVAAFAGALAGVSLTLLLAGGAARPLKLLLCGVVVGVLAGAVSDLLLLVAPEALRGRHVFLLGSTGFLGWSALGWLAGMGLLVAVPALCFARVLDALVLGEASASSLGLRLPQLRLLLVALMALATGTVVSQAGLVGFVGLVAPHLVRRLVHVSHRGLLALSAAAGGVLLLVADVAARSLIAPQELPVGVLTALLGGVYLLVLLRRPGGAG